MQTPDEVLEDLERMGEAVVRERLAAGHFGGRKTPLVEGWLKRLEEARAAVNREREARAPRQPDRSAEAVSLARQARVAAERAMRQAQIALALAAVGLLLGLAGLIALAVG